METSGRRMLAGDFPVPEAAEWRALAARAAGAAGLEGLVGCTDDGVPIEPLYAPALGNAGADRSPSGGWPQVWEIVQPHRHPDPAQAGKEAREDLDSGAHAVLFHLDRGIARGGGRPDGVLVYDRAAFEKLVAALPVGGSTIRFEAGERALDRLADLEALRGPGREPDVADWRILADPVGAALTGAPDDPSAALDACVAAFDRSPFLHVLADGRPWYEAGASEAQEIAAVLASATLWLRRAESAGIALETILPRLELVFAVDADLFLSLAKLRAARLAFERILEAAGLGDRRENVRIRAETGSRMLSRLDPWVNILRTTVAALAAVAGGADAVTVQPFDRPLGPASPLARRIARNIQLVLREEAGVGRVRDPAAGAWYVAHLTRSLAEAAWTKLQGIEAEGGLLAALRAGRLQAEVETIRLAREARVARGSDRLVGVSAFPILEGKAPPEAEGDIREALEAARTVLAARPTMGGTVPFRPLRPVRLAEPFERLRERAEAAKRRDGRRPAVPVVALGRSSELHELTTRVENLLAAGGFEAISVRLGGPNEAGEAWRRIAGPVVIACIGASEARRAAELVDALRSAGADRLWIVGSADPLPGGVSVIGSDFDLLAFLGELHERLATPKTVSGGLE